MTIRFARATDEHAAHIAAHARQADVDELWAYCRATPLETMTQGMARSQAMTGLIEEEPVAMFGVTPYSLLGGIGTPWMVGSTRLATGTGKRAIMLTCRDVMAWMQAQAPRLLYNLVDERNDMAKHWLERLGFTLGAVMPAGPDRMPFRIFYWRAT